MHRIDHPTAAPGNLFTDGNPATATPATTVTDDWLNDVQGNICDVVENAGIALVKGNYTQLRQAIQAMLIASQKAVIINNATFEASVSNGEVVRWDSGNSRFDEAVADGTINNRAVGIADVTNSKVYLYGECPLFSGLTPGVRYYLDGSTAGAITMTAPTDAVMVGIAKSASVLWIDVDVQASPASARDKKNLVVDGACRMAQLAAKTITTSAQYGAVDMFAAWATGTAVSAGSIAQSSSAPIGQEGFSLHLSGVTVTGSGVVYARHRVESAIAKALKNKTASFSVQVYHDVGAAVNYSVVIRKANAVDNFSGVTVIATSPATAVANTTGTLLKFENVAMGDCSNGIEIEVQAACGAVVTKNFHFTEWQLEEGASASSFEWPSIVSNIDNVLRYLEKTYDIETLPGSVTFLGAFVGDASGQNDLSCPFRVGKRAIPSITYYSALSGASGVVAYKNTMTIGPQGDIAVEASYLSKGMLSVQTNPGDNYMPIIHFVADCRL